VPKHGWKWRTERFRNLSPQEQEDELNDRGIHFSAKFGRWAYSELPLTDRARRAALVIIGTDEAADWTHQFLLGELDRLWDKPIGSFVISAIGRKRKWDPELLDRFEGFFNNTELPPCVRGVSLYAMGMSWLRCPRQEREAYENRLRPLCEIALWHPDPELRRGACPAACLVGGFGKRIHELTQDQATDDLGNTVAEVAEDWDIDPAG